MIAKFATGWRQVAVGFVLLATIAMIASCYSIIAVPLLKEFQPSRFVLGQAMRLHPRNLPQASDAVAAPAE